MNLNPTLKLRQMKLFPPNTLVPQPAFRKFTRCMLCIVFTLPAIVNLLHDMWEKVLSFWFGVGAAPFPSIRPSVFQLLNPSLHRTSNGNNNSRKNQNNQQLTTRNHDHSYNSNKTTNNQQQTANIQQATGNSQNHNKNNNINSNNNLNFLSGW